MTSSTAIKSDTYSLLLDGEAIHFTPASCMLTADELDEKCEEQFAVIWNGLNKPTVSG